MDTMLESNYTMCEFDFQSGFSYSNARDGTTIQLYKLNVLENSEKSHEILEKIINKKPRSQINNSKFLSSYGLKLDKNKEQLILSSNNRHAKKWLTKLMIDFLGLKLQLREVYFSINEFKEAISDIIPSTPMLKEILSKIMSMRSDALHRVLETCASGKYFKNLLMPLKIDFCKKCECYIDHKDRSNCKICDKPHIIDFAEKIKSRPSVLRNIKTTPEKQAIGRVVSSLMILDNTYSSNGKMMASFPTMIPNDLEKVYTSLPSDPKKININLKLMSGKFPVKSSLREKFNAESCRQAIKYCKQYLPEYEDVELNENLVDDSVEEFQIDDLEKIHSLQKSLTTVLKSIRAMDKPWLLKIEDLRTKIYPSSDQISLNLSNLYLYVTDDSTRMKILGDLKLQYRSLYSLCRDIEDISDNLDKSNSKQPTTNRFHREKAKKIFNKIWSYVFTDKIISDTSAKKILMGINRPVVLLKNEKNFSCDNRLFRQAFPYIFFCLPKDPNENELDLSKAQHRKDLAKFILSNKDYFLRTDYYFLYTLLGLHVWRKALKKLNFKLKNARLNKNQPINVLNKHGAVYWTLKTISGTQRNLNEIRQKVYSMMTILGPPSFLITLTRGERSDKHLEKSLEDIDCERTMIQRKKSLELLITRDFRYKVKQYIKVMAERYPFLGDHFLRYEFQLRGADHAHIVWWTTEPVNLSQLREIKQVTIPTNHPYSRHLEVQRHHCVPELCKAKRFGCGFPIFALKEDIILRKIETNSIFQNIVKEYKTWLSSISDNGKNADILEDLDLEKDFLDVKDIPYDLYVEAVQTTIRGSIGTPSSMLARKIKDVYTTEYSLEATIITGGSSNVLFGSSIKFGDYICKYSTKKGENGADNNILAIKSEKPVNKDTSSEELSKLTDAKVLFKEIANLLGSCRQVAETEAIYMLSGWSIDGCSRDFRFVDMREPSERNRIIDFKAIKSDDVNTEGEISFKGDCWSKFEKRPDELEDLVFFEFITDYNFDYTKSKRQFMVMFNPEIDIFDRSIFKRLFTSWRVEPESSMTLENISSDEYCKGEKLHEEYFSFNVDEMLIENDIMETDISNPLDDEIRLKPITKDTPELGVFINKSNETISERRLAYSQKLSKLNDDQYFICQNIHDSILNAERINYFIDGSAGTGKSFTLKAIMRLLEYLDNKYVALAPTGVSAEVIGGVTMHRCFGWSKKYNNYCHLTNYNLNELKRKLNGLQTVIIDEIGRVSAEQLEGINQNLQKLLGNDTNFGGLNVILVGDILQCSAIQESPIYQHRTSSKTKGMFLGKSVFNDFQFMTLIEIVRQENHDFISFLQKMRKGQLETVDVVRVNLQLSLTLEKDVLLSEDMIVLTGTNKKANYWNKRIVDKIIDENDFESYEFIAKDRLIYSNMLRSEEDIQDLNEKIQDLSIAETFNLPYKIRLFISQQLKITKNHYSADGKIMLANGTFVRVLEIDSHNNPKVCVLSDESKIYTIRPMTEFGFIRSLNISMQRCSLPCVECYAITIHSAQSLTLSQKRVIFDDQELPNNCAGLKYTQYSRIRSLDQLTLVGKKLDIKTIQTDMAAVEMLNKKLVSSQSKIRPEYNYFIINCNKKPDETWVNIKKYLCNCDLRKITCIALLDIGENFEGFLEGFTVSKIINRTITMLFVNGECDLNIHNQPSTWSYSIKISSGINIIYSSGDLSIDNLASENYLTVGYFNRSPTNKCLFQLPKRNSESGWNQERLTTNIVNKLKDKTRLIYGRIVGMAASESDMVALKLD